MTSIPDSNSRLTEFNRAVIRWKNAQDLSPHRNRERLKNMLLLVGFATDMNTGRATLSRAEIVRRSRRGKHGIRPVSDGAVKNQLAALAEIGLVEAVPGKQAGQPNTASTYVPQFTRRRAADGSLADYEFGLTCPTPDDATCPTTCPTVSPSNTRGTNSTTSTTNPTGAIADALASRQDDSSAADSSDDAATRADDNQPSSGRDGEHQPAAAVNGAGGAVVTTMGNCERCEKSGRPGVPGTECCLGPVGASEWTSQLSLCDGCQREASEGGYYLMQVEVVQQVTRAPRAMKAKPAKPVSPVEHAAQALAAAHYEAVRGRSAQSFIAIKKIIMGTLANGVPEADIAAALEQMRAGPWSVSSGALTKALGDVQRRRPKQVNYAEEDYKRACSGGR